MPRIADRYCRFAQRVAQFIERHPFVLLAAFTLVYFATACPLAERKLLWHDEIFTVRIARQPTLAALWAALGSGMDANPPLNYLATRAACAILGDGPVAYRLPALVGFWLFCVCLFLFVAHRCGRAFACLAVLFALATDAHHTFAYEARPYGLLLGWAGLALLCWQRTGEGNSRAARAGLALSLAAALATHYYAVLLFVPLGLAEAARSWRRWRIDLAVWACFAVGLLSLAAFLPLAQQARAVLGTGFWARPTLEKLATFYKELLGVDVLACVAVLLFLAVYPRLRTADEEQPHEQPSSLPPEEILVAVAFAALPFFAFALGKLVTGAFAHRYAITAVIGPSVAFACAARHYSRCCPVLAVSVGGILLAWWLATDVVRLQEMEGKRAEFAAAHDRLARQAERAGVLAVSDPLAYLQHAYYAPALRPRLVYLCSPRLALRYKGSNTTDLALLLLSRWSDLNVLDCEEFVAAHREFAVHDRGGWLAAALADRDLLLTKKPHNLLEVSPADEPGASATGVGRAGSVSDRRFDNSGR